MNILYEIRNSEYRIDIIVSQNANSNKSIGTINQYEKRVWKIQKECMILTSFKTRMISI